jgi:hypothetical protein
VRVLRGSSSAGSSGGGGSVGSSSSSTVAAAPPSLQEVAKAIAALRDAAAEGADIIVDPLLKAGLVMAQWLHRVVIAVWVSGKAPRSVPLSCLSSKGKVSARKLSTPSP